MIGELDTLWTAAGVIFGFEATAFLWRINREVSIADRGAQTGLWAADYLNIAAMVAIGGGVFVLPILGVGDADLAASWLGLSVVLLAGHAFATAGHYGFFDPSSPRPRRVPNDPQSSVHPFPRQEKVAVYGTVALAVAYIVAAILWGAV